MRIYYYDDLHRSVIPTCPTRKWRIQWIWEPDGWEASIQKRGENGWSREKAIFLIGHDWRPKEALKVWQDD